MGFLKPPKVDLAAPQAPPVPPLQVQAANKPQRKPMTPTFLGAEKTPSMGDLAGNNRTSNTLLGQA